MAGSSPLESEFSPRPVARERQASHVLLLIVLASLLLFSGAAARQVVLEGVPSASALAAANSAANLDDPNRVQLFGGPGVDLVGTWFQALRPTTLWSGPEGAATPVTEVAEGAYLQLVGQVQGPRVEVRYPGEGGVAALNAWVNTSDISPSAPPVVAAVVPTSAPTSAPPVVAVAPPVLGPTKVGDEEPPYVSAEYAVLVDGASGQVLWEYDGYGRVAPASLTKIVTAQLALEQVSLDERVTVNVDSRTMWESTVMGLVPGENVAMRTLLYGLMLPSGNDAALAIAEHVGGSQAAFAQMMNDRVAELGLRDSHFMNPHGLDEDGHYSSAYDMVMLARHGMQDGNFRALAAAKSWSGEGYQLTNLNGMLWYYDGADGVKVGYTDNSGRAIVASATVGGHRVYVGLMRAPTMNEDCVALFNYAFNNWEWPPQEFVDPA